MPGIYRPPQSDYGIKEAADALQGGITQIGSIFKDRYDRKQYEDFLSGPGKDYQDQMKAAQDMLLDHDNADAAQQAVHNLKNATNDFMDNATRFSDNPYIMSKAKRVWDGHMSFIKDEFTSKLQDARIAKEQALMQNAKDIGPLKRQETEANIDLKKAQADKARAEAEGRIGKGATKGVVSFLSGDPTQLSEIGDPSARAEAAHANISAQITQPRDERARKQIDMGIKQELLEEAKQRVAAKVSRNEVRPAYMGDDGARHGGDKWDTSNPEHVQYMAGLIDPSVAKERFIINTIRGESSATGVDANIVDQKYGAIIDPTRATSANPVTRPLNEDELGKVLLGGEGWRGAQALDRDDEGNPILDKTGRQLRHGATTIDEAIRTLPPKFNDLTKGPLTDSIDNAIQEMTAKVQAGQLKLTKENVKTYIRRTMIQDVVGPLIGGEHAETAGLPEGLKRNRLDGKKLAEAMADRYANELYNRIMGIQEKEPAPPKEAAPSTPLFSREFLKRTPLGTIAEDISGQGTFSKVKGILNPGKK